MGEVQYITDDQNNITGVIVPIELWRELQAEKVICCATVNVAIYYLYDKKFQA
jgi:hypothetical protein